MKVMKLSRVICAIVVGLFVVQQGSACGGGKSGKFHVTGPVRMGTNDTGTNGTKHFRFVFIEDETEGSPVESTSNPQEVHSLLWTFAIQGALRGLDYCQYLFRNEKWKCPSEVYRELPIFDNTTLADATRETAFIHAISAAAVTHEITLQCRLRKIPGCRCAEVTEKPRNGSDDWQWGGCGDNFKYGDQEAGRLLDNLERENDASAAVNRHNNEVGRKVVQANLQRKCEWKNCWKVLAPFEDVASQLKQKYHNAVRVWFVNNKLQERINNQFRNVTVSDTEQKLVYLDSSSGDQAQNTTQGSPGKL